MTKCKDCQAFDKEEDLCRRSSPQLMPGLKYGVWPKVNEEDGCGEGVPKNEA